jgi:hypothetical protein
MVAIGSVSLMLATSQNERTRTLAGVSGVQKAGGGSFTFGVAVGSTDFAVNVLKVWSERKLRDTSHPQTTDIDSATDQDVKKDGSTPAATRKTE